VTINIRRACAAVNSSRLTHFASVEFPLPSHSFRPLHIVATTSIRSTTASTQFIVVSSEVSIRGVLWQNRVEEARKKGMEIRFFLQG